MIRSGARAAIFFSLLLAALFGSASQVLPASAAADTVTDCSDTILYYPGTTNPYPAPGTLRAVVQNATAGDTISFTCSGTIYLSGLGVIYIAQNLTIDGSGQSVTLDGGSGNGGCALGWFGVENNASVTLRNLTIANCQTGKTNNGGGGPAAVSVNPGSTLTVSNSTFSGNSDGTALGTGAIFNAGTLNVSDSTFSGNRGTHGGGIQNNGCNAVLTVNDSTFSNNSVYYDGGGIVNYCGTATVTNSTFSGNLAAHSPAGGGNGGNGGGGAIASSGTLTVSNSTFSGNSATGGVGGAIMNWGNSATVTNSTFSGNTGGATYVDGSGNFVHGAGGIFDGEFGNNTPSGSGTTKLVNTILAGNGVNCAGTLPTNQGNNFADDGTCGVTQVSTSDLKLGSLANNGGPTQTIALGSGSVAINAGNDAICAAAPVSNRDQRGYTRPSGSHCDIGAFEFGAVNPIQTTALGAVSGSGSFAGTASLTATLTVNGTGVSGKSISFTRNGSSVGSATTNSNGVATLSNVSLSGINAGSYPGAIGASFAGDSGYTSSSGTGTLSVSKANQTITFNLSSLPQKSWGDAPFSITSYASASSGLPVSFSTATSPICTVSDGTVTILTSGTCTINANQAGNSNYNPAPQVQQSFTVTDTTPPTTTGSAVKADNSAYTFGAWTNQAVTITLSASDTGGSGLAHTFYTLDSGAQTTYSAPFTISTEASHTVTFWSTDNADNEETPHHSVSVNIDLTAPTISGAATTNPNGNGWYNASVTIHWTCSDALSGIATCPSDQTISGEGASQTLSGTATDLAGNSTTVNSSPVSIDLTAPTISGAATTAPNGNGWYNASVTIHWTCSDALSGIATCPSDQTISGEGANQTLSGTATDNAGNSTTVNSSPVSIDLTAPTISGAATTAPTATAGTTPPSRFTGPAVMRSPASPPVPVTRRSVARGPARRSPAPPPTRRQQHHRQQQSGQYRPDGSSDHLFW